MSIKTRKIDDSTFEVVKEGNMLVPGIVFGDDEVREDLIHDYNEKQKKKGSFTPSLEQIRNVACLPGIQKASLAMADVHPGYGFTIGGVGAFDMDEGVVSMAGVGFDINCGVRMLRTDFLKSDIQDKKEDLANELAKIIPAGLGSKGDIRLTEKELNKVLVQGSRYIVEQGYGFPEDLIYTEEEGQIKNADPDTVSEKAKLRQFKQVGTLGSGNHYLEVQYVSEIFDKEAALAYNIEEGQVLVSIHCGSRALGHQIGTDYLKVLEQASRKYKIPIFDKELVCAPIKSKEGRQYISAVNCGINTAFANRQALTHLTRLAFKNIFHMGTHELSVLYDVGHNTCKVEKHEVELRKNKFIEKELLVHRKGATRAFGPGRIEVPEKYRHVGQPLLVGGSMGTASYILRGTELGMKKCFGSAVHGAGRAMSRMKAKHEFRGTEIIKELKEQGIIIRAVSRSGVAEEAPRAYKDVHKVVDIMHKSGVNEKVAMLKPIICIKG